MKAICDARMNDQQISCWINKISSTNELQKNLAASALHGIYCDSDKIEEARKNALDISRGIKDDFTQKAVENILVQHEKYRECQTAKLRKSEEFFTKIRMHNLLDETTKCSLFSNACSRLKAAHYEYNNFHNEPPYAEKLFDMQFDCTVPGVVKYSYVEVIVLCGMGNPYGVSRDAYEFYKKMVQSFSAKKYRS